MAGLSHLWHRLQGMICPDLAILSSLQTGHLKSTTSHCESSDPVTLTLSATESVCTSARLDATQRLDSSISSKLLTHIAELVELLKRAARLCICSTSCMAYLTLLFASCTATLTYLPS